jgi:hypothetical protein
MTDARVTRDAWEVFVIQAGADITAEVSRVAMEILVITPNEAQGNRRRPLARRGG